MTVTTATSLCRAAAASIWDRIDPAGPEAKLVVPTASRDDPRQTTREPIPLDRETVTPPFSIEVGALTGYRFTSDDFVADDHAHFGLYIEVRPELRFVESFRFTYARSESKTDRRVLTLLSESILSDSIQRINVAPDDPRMVGDNVGSPSAPVVVTADETKRSDTDIDWFTIEWVPVSLPVLDERLTARPRAILGIVLLEDRWQSETAIGGGAGVDLRYEWPSGWVVGASAQVNYTALDWAFGDSAVSSQIEINAGFSF
ncbi:MAG: hypothetical protein GVY36_07050 [Verrucomicrobia bacterium]|nr:hypothetical protein [Verrucomicrobiota bacterium]